MRICLDHVARMLTGDRLDNATVSGQGQPWHHLRYEHTAWIREQIDQMDWSPAYRNKHLAALRGVLKEAWKLGLLSTDDHQRAVALAPFGGYREPAGQHVPDTVIGALIAACDADRSPSGAVAGSGLRDAAIIAVLDSCGLRRAELVALQYADYDRARRMLIVIGKGDNQRRIPVNSFAARRPPPAARRPPPAAWRRGSPAAAAAVARCSLVSRAAGRYAPPPTVAPGR